jgi:hypothetical protein
MQITPVVEITDSEQPYQLTQSGSFLVARSNFGIDLPAYRRERGNVHPSATGRLRTPSRRGCVYPNADIDTQLKFATVDGLRAEQSDWDKCKPGAG